MKRIFLFLAGFVMAFGLMAPPVQSRVSQADSSQTQAQPEVKSFTGTILKSGEDLVLSDAATKSRYMLDNQDRVRSYQGKRVTVTGIIDVASNLIHVETIEEIV
jgi:hypothetical protein